MVSLRGQTLCLLFSDATSSFLLVAQRRGKTTRTHVINRLHARMHARILAGRSRQIAVHCSPMQASSCYKPARERVLASLRVPLTFARNQLTRLERLAGRLAFDISLARSTSRDRRCQQKVTSSWRVQPLGEIVTLHKKRR